MSRPIRLTAVLLGALLAGSASAQTNLIANPGFESGDFTSWTVWGESRPDHTFVSSPTHYPGWDEFLPHGGNAFAALGGVGSPVVLSQEFPTTPGETYTFSFHLGSDGETPNEIVVMFGGYTFVLQRSDETETPGHDLIHGPAAAAYTVYSFPAVAEGVLTTISFQARNDQGWWALDDVSVTLPEPSSLASLGAGILALCACARCRRRSSS